MSAASDKSMIRVELGPRSYEIQISSGAIAEFGGVASRWLAERYGGTGRRKQGLVVTDTNVAERHAAEVRRSLQGAGWEEGEIVLPAGEKTKCLDVVSRLYDRLVEMQADRGTVVIAVGGGVIGDVAGFAAATYARGLPFIQVPTTLLADVDSSVGGKVGVNHPRGKNLIGAFHQPIGVFIDTQVLGTLGDRDYRSGMAEVVKYGVILDAEFFGYLEQNTQALNRRDAQALRHVISQSCVLKAKVVSADEFERTGLRAVLNYGHTFAHAYEALCEYGELEHGEAVAIGMLHASRLAERIGRVDATVTERQREMMQSMKMMTEFPPGIRLRVDEIIERMRLDKKSVGGKLRFVLPSRIGHVETVDGVPEGEVRAVLLEAGAK